MTLLEQIQSEAIDSSSDLGSILRKCKLLANRLRSQELEEWLLLESNGYPVDESVPDYRRWPLQVVGDFAGAMGSGLRNAVVPSVCVPEEIREKIVNYKCHQSISGMEQLVQDNRDPNLTVQIRDLQFILGENVFKGQNCIAAWGQFPIGQFREALNAVRNRVLDFALALAKEYPDVGETTPESNESVASEVTQIFNTTILQGSANIIGTAQGSTITYGIQLGDFESLSQTLRENQVSTEDIAALQRVLEAEPALDGTDFGPQVADWIGNMMGKAAKGTWQIGLNAAGSLLATVIGKFYGLI